MARESILIHYLSDTLIYSHSPHPLPPLLEGEGEINKKRAKPSNQRASKRDGVPLKDYAPFPLLRGRGQGDRVSVFRKLGRVIRIGVTYLSKREQKESAWRTFR
jgi:hypothetical protein